MTAEIFADPAPAPSQYAGRVRFSNGRYRLPDPDTGKEVSFTRVSTVAKVLEDTYALEAWKDRMLAKGLAMRPDLTMLAGATPLEDKQTFSDLTKSARDTAGATGGANHGTAFHSLTEIVDKGLPIPQGTHLDNVKRLDLYRRSLQTHGLTVLPNWMERVVLNREYRLVGRTDRALFVDDMAVLDNLPIPDIESGHVIGDLKTQKTMDYGCMSIAMQLAIYARADLVWDEEHGVWEEPDVELNRDVAVVMHVPSDRVAADIHVIDIARGWELVQVAMSIREARKETLNRKLNVKVDDKWERAILNAKTKRELSQIYRGASDAGEWTDELMALGMSRKAEIEKGVQAHDGRVG